MTESLSKSLSISIVDAIDTQQALNSTVIQEVLDSGQKNMVHGGNFTGRTTTIVYASSEYVVKLRSGLSFRPADCVRWIRQTLEHERLLGIYHPAKTWFIWHKDGVDIIGNIMPILIPLHRYAADDMEQKTSALVMMLDMYLRTAATHDCRLDEGLSNFGLDIHSKPHKLYYLDDDLYAWDGYTSLSQLVGVWFRQLTALTEKCSHRLGAGIRSGILKYFGDPHHLMIFGHQLRSGIVITHKHQLLTDACLQGLWREEPQQSTLEKTLPLSTPIALLADIHANLPALEAVLEKLTAMGVQSGLVLGDTVGYGPHAPECIQRLQNWTGFQIIKGNHDHAVAQHFFQGGFSDSGRWVIDWTRQHQSESDRQWLDNLPVFLEGKLGNNHWLAVHGAPCDKTFFTAYVYYSTYHTNLDVMAERNLRWCFHGHSHIQGCYVEHQNGKRYFEPSETQNLLHYRHTLVCPGAVGQGRGGKVGAEFALFWPDTGEIRFYRIPYAVEQTIADMKQHNFPEKLMDRLLKGK